MFVSERNSTRRSSRSVFFNRFQRNTHITSIGFSWISSRNWTVRNSQTNQNFCIALIVCFPFEIRSFSHMNTLLYIRRRYALQFASLPSHLFSYFDTSSVYLLFSHFPHSITPTECCVCCSLVRKYNIFSNQASHPYMNIHLSINPPHFQWNIFLIGVSRQHI